MVAAEVAALIRGFVTKSCPCGVKHTETGYHVAATHGIFHKHDQNGLKGANVRIHPVLGKTAGKGHEAEDQLMTVRFV
jgi:hypothetical protein